MQEEDFSEVNMGASDTTEKDWEQHYRCDGCKYENSTDIREHLAYCSYCKRAYYEDEVINLDDKYEPI